MAMKQPPARLDSNSVTVGAIRQHGCLLSRVTVVCLAIKQTLAHTVVRPGEEDVVLEDEEDVESDGLLQGEKQADKMLTPCHDEKQQHDNHTEAPEMSSKGDEVLEDEKDIQLDGLLHGEKQRQVRQ